MEQHGIHGVMQPVTNGGEPRARLKIRVGKDPWYPWYRRRAKDDAREGESLEGTYGVVWCPCQWWPPKKKGIVVSG